MFGLGDNDDDERMWNFLLFSFYGTDKEFEESSPTILIVMILIIIGIIVYWAFF